MKITVIGSGYVGTTTAAILAHTAHTAIALDINAERVKAIQAGKAPFFEAGLDNLVAAGIKAGTLTATTSYQTAIPEADIIFSCVGTPDNPDGSSNLDYIYASAQSAAPLFKKGVIFVQKSTVPPGTGEELIRFLLQHTTREFDYVSNPEFLREGTAIEDTLLFDRIVAGSHNLKAAEVILKLYEDIFKHRHTIAKISALDIDGSKLKLHQGQYLPTSLNSAELIKVTANAFLALKISFANSIAKLADQANADILEVMNGIGTDQRIGRAFLNAGRGYGGGCFPKDVSGLISSASNHGIDLSIMKAADELNSSMPGYIANKAKEILGSLEGKKCAVLGLAFKSGTSDARKSPAVKLANILAHDGAIVCAYDPRAMEEASHDLRKDIKLCKSDLEVVKNADAVFVATDWSEFKQADLERYAKNMAGKLFIDCMNMFDVKDVTNHGLRYVGVGRN